MANSIRKFTELPLQNQPALGQRVICDIPTTADLENLLIMCSGSFQLTTGATSLYNSDGVLNLFTAVELIGDGRDTIVSLPMYQIVQANIFRKKLGLAPVVSQPGFGIAVNAWSFDGYIDLAAFMGLRAKDSSVRENAYKTLQLAIRIGGDLTGVYAGAFVNTTNTFALTILARETIELPDANGVASAPIMRPLQSARDDQFAGAVNRQRFRLTPEQGLRGLSIRALTSVGALSDAILSRVRIYVGKDLRLDMSAASLKELNKHTGHAPGTGYYFIDLADGEGSPDKMNDALDLRQAITQNADSYIEYDTLAAGTCNIAQFGYVAL